MEILGAVDGEEAATLAFFLGFGEFREDGSSCCFLEGLLLEGDCEMGPK
jgi:hypothetical protein